MIRIKILVIKYNNDYAAIEATKVIRLPNLFNI